MKVYNLFISDMEAWICPINLHYNHVYLCHFCSHKDAYLLPSASALAHTNEMHNVVSMSGPSAAMPDKCVCHSQLMVK